MEHAIYKPNYMNNVVTYFVLLRVQHVVALLAETDPNKTWSFTTNFALTHGGC